ncbi:MAG: nicotinamide-nucleotide amidohydrolase family protein [Bifidobacteriaceae bacterium]|jgi:nicotinamide-nucleotide amidase|nr:nicotinamide-nucleotide amidohydrolase family protein [Bifidobacteriaceae bacterium]
MSPFRNIGGLDNETRAIALVNLLREHNLTVATAESLTGGLVSAVIVDVPGASDVLRGAVVAYANEIKRDVLGVDAELLEERGAINGTAAAQMAIGVRHLLGADVGISTTGVAGPGPADGSPPGTAFVACSWAKDEPAVRALRLEGGRAQVRTQVVTRALELAEATIRQTTGI